MRKRLAQLQAQHPAVRTRVAVLSASVITGLVLLMWFATLPTRFSSNTVSSNAPESSVASAISGLSDALAPQVGAIQSSFDSIGGLQVVPNPSDNNTPPTTSGTSADAAASGY